MRAMSSDESIVFDVLNGDRESFGTLVERYQHAAVRMAFHLVGNRDAADDVAQDAFITAYRSLRNLRDQAKFKSWFFSIVHHKCLKHLERRRAESSLDEVADDGAVADPQPDGDDDSLLTLMNRLPLEYREVLAARYVSELNYDEIAQALGTTTGNVRVRCLRAKQKLRELFKREQTRCKSGE